MTVYRCVHTCVYRCVCMRACVRACVRGLVRACVRVCGYPDGGLSPVFYQWSVCLPWVLGDKRVFLHPGISVCFSSSFPFLAAEAISFDSKGIRRELRSGYSFSYTPGFGDLITSGRVMGGTSKKSFTSSGVSGSAATAGNDPSPLTNVTDSSSCRTSLVEM